jgi:hypothetical protein
LYEARGKLQVLFALRDVVEDAGFLHRTHDFLRGDAVGFYMRLWADGRPPVNTLQPEHGRIDRLSPTGALAGTGL